MNYEKDINIDESALDIEWLNQPRLMYEYAANAADKQLTADKKKENMELVKAELDRKIREKPEKFELTKLTETIVANTIITCEKYQDALEIYNEARYHLQIARAAVQAIDQRKTALENLVKLHGQQYFAGPSAPRDISKEWELSERDKQTQQKIKMKRTSSTNKD